MKRKFLVILSAMCILSANAYGNGTKALANAELSTLESISEIVQAEFKDTQLAETVNSDGSILYVTAGTNEDTEKLAEVLGQAATESWFDYDYVMLSQYYEDYLVVSILLKCDDYQMTFHAWFDDNGKLIDMGDGSNTETEKSEISENQRSATDSQMTMSQKNALSKAKDYLNLTAFSYTGLIKQLEFEGFSNEDATYAADHCGADWNEQAAKKAQDYLDLTAFSRSGLIDQLVYEGFTNEQAEYGVSAVGY
ncbi:Ltp family lipoprotein [Murimonas intestini]|uniref:Host cell surface-exposed lipoprotein n=1 Tax=Murimonas intestini TaxID=1337051 RepID=A0AB73T9S6_9FIRM|nr:Ltp family lipoprotein [Murimonas intestini]MCR1839320.1 Ltp family lipoprotein [Murimonas intestini]MCR1864615.1 Ltp family lipoprotein [Murimonas intestini]MCR1882225.1 Ltp family lipoprotein [Murimonas intestini]